MDQNYWKERQKEIFGVWRDGQKVENVFKVLRRDLEGNVVPKCNGDEDFPTGLFIVIMSPRLRQLRKSSLIVFSITSPKHVMNLPLNSEM